MRVLLTGFEPYGGRSFNPAFETMRALDGREIGGAAVVGRALPVSLKSLRQGLAQHLEEVRPQAVIALGLWPGEPMIRLERIGINVADFEIADNQGARPGDGMVQPDGSPAKVATLPLRSIETAILAEGIPVRISSTAGTFLCNACLYTLLDLLDQGGRRDVPAGFIHVPYAPVQVAQMLKDLRAEAVLELHQRADLSSMDLMATVKAIEIAIAVTVGSLRG
ncbi:MAG: pyroglutamyl-peptidase I [Aestuariivirgaceae bacterium]